MTVMRTGSTKKYSDNWDNIFGGKKSKGTSGATSKSAKKKTAKKKVAKKGKKKAKK